MTERATKQNIKKITEALKYRGSQISFYPERVEGYYREQLRQIRTNLKRSLKK